VAHGYSISVSDGVVAMERYDVLIIGAGITGAALLLSFPV